MLSPQLMNYFPVTSPLSSALLGEKWPDFEHTWSLCEIKKQVLTFGVGSLKLGFSLCPLNIKLREVGTTPLPGQYPGRAG